MAYIPWIPGAKPTASVLKTGGPSAQTSDVIRHRLDLAVVHLGGHTGHLDIVVAAAVAEGFELCFGVGRVLTGQARILRRNTGTVGAVAARASGDLAIRNATAVNALTQPDGVFVGGNARRDFLFGQPEADVAHVFIRQSGGETLHHRVGALALFELFELFDQIFGVLLSQLGVLGQGGVAVGRVAGDAHLAVGRSPFRQIGLGRLRLSAERQDSGTGREDQRGRQFHGEAALLKTRRVDGS